MGWLFLTQNCLEAYANAYTPQGQTSDQPWMAGRAAMSSSKGSQNGNPRCVIAVWQSQLQSAETMIHSFMARMSRFSLHYSSSLSPLKESMSVIQLHQSHCIRKYFAALRFHYRIVLWIGAKHCAESCHALFAYLRIQDPLHSRKSHGL